ncbi:hypothetical protein F5Y16DRAFT_27320 [Xylariaceae sp. FL0255]|nr:hypothetical protein F5Y16DRAFT_27320 [Xylariaceae sp. FL0255]
MPALPHDERWALGIRGQNGVVNEFQIQKRHSSHFDISREQSGHGKDKNDDHKKSDNNFDQGDNGHSGDDNDDNNRDNGDNGDDGSDSQNNGDDGGGDTHNGGNSGEASSSVSSTSSSSTSTSTSTSTTAVASTATVTSVSTATSITTSVETSVTSATQTVLTPGTAASESPVLVPAVSGSSTITTSATTTATTSASGQQSASATASSISSVANTSDLPFVTPIPAPPISVPDSRNNNTNNNHDPHHQKSSNDNGQPDPAVRGVLIAIGTVGGVIILCFLGFLLYRAMKKNKQINAKMSQIRFFNKFFPTDVDQPQATSAAINSAVTSKSAGAAANDLPPSYDYSTVDYQAQNTGFPVQEKAFTPGYYGNLSSNPSNEGNGGEWYQQEQQRPQYLPPPSNQDETRTNDSGSTFRSRMPDPYYNQSELARQPSEARDPAQRQVYRASELSSISSGWGDGDIIIPPTETEPNPPPVKTPKSTLSLIVGSQFSLPKLNGGNTSSDNADNGDGESEGSNGRDQRDTVYTVASDDRPARFRSIHSWVAQQKGRAKRADFRARERGEVPVMPAVPGQAAATRSTAYR